MGHMATAWVRGTHSDGTPWEATRATAMAQTRATGRRGEGAWDGKEAAWARRVYGGHRGA